MPTISIIIPVHNSQKTIENCLKRIYSSNYKNFEVILVDDCSKDNSIKIAKKFKAKIIKLKTNSGAAAARNAGIKAAKGKYTLFIDSDVLIEKDTVKNLLSSIKSRKADAVLAIYTKQPYYNNFISTYHNLFQIYTFFEQPSSASETFPGFSTACSIIKTDIIKKFSFNQNSIVEDMELGNILIKNNYKIYLDKSIKVQHCHLYTFKKTIKHYFKRTRGWIKMLKSQKINSISKATHFNISSLISIPSAFLFFLSLMFIDTFIPFTFLLLFVLSNIGFYKFLLKEKGLLFALQSIFLSLILNIIIGIGILAGLIKQ